MSKNSNEESKNSNNRFESLRDILAKEDKAALEKDDASRDMPDPNEIKTRRGP